MNQTLLESGLAFGKLPDNPKKSKSLLRIWRSLSSLQRNLIRVITFLFVFSGILFVLPKSDRILDRRKVEFEVVPGALPDGAASKMMSNFQISAVIIPLDNAQSESATNNLDAKLQIARENMQTPSIDEIFGKFRGPDNPRAKSVVSAMQHAWSNYKKFAWGKDHLRPNSKSGQDWFGLGLTIVDSLDTLILMGLKEEYQEARNFVANDLNYDKSSNYVNLFETTIRVLGGLLSAHTLTKDPLFKEKAMDLGNRMLGAFSTPSGIPHSDVNLKLQKGKAPTWGAGASLSEVSTLQLEFRELSRISGNPLFEKSTFHISEHIHKMGCSKHNGLCPMFMNTKTGKWIYESGGITLGARADSYYEYILKQWVQTGKTIDWLRTDWLEAMASMDEKLVRKSEPNKLTFVGELQAGDKFYAKMDHLACFISGSLALSHQLNLDPSGRHLELAKELGQTCYMMYEATATKLGPEIAHFNMLNAKDLKDITIKPLDAHSLLRPEAIEAWFYLYRVTGDKMYQDWGWAAFQAIEKYARVSHGYSSVTNAKKIPVVYRDMMESFFLAETLKYLYLLLLDDQSILPLDKFVFNTEAHPLPVYSS